MRFASVRVVTNDVDALKAFYSKLTGIAPTDLAPGFAEIRFEGCTLAISITEIIDKVNGGVIVPGANRSSMIEFEVSDVEAVRAQIASSMPEAIVQQPTTMPWGNVSMLLRDPDGAVVNIYSRPNR